MGGFILGLRATTKWAISEDALIRAERINVRIQNWRKDIASQKHFINRDQRCELIEKP